MVRLPSCNLLRFGLFDLTTPFLAWESIALVAAGPAVFFLAVLAFRRIQV